MKTAVSTKLTSNPLPANRNSQQTPGGLPIKLESKQSIRAFQPVPNSFRQPLVRRSSKAHIEVLRTETSKNNISVNNMASPNLTHSLIQEDRKSVSIRNLPSERARPAPLKPLPPLKVAPPRTPTRAESKPSLTLIRKSSNSNIIKTPQLPQIDMFVTETFEEPKKLSVQSIDRPINGRKEQEIMMKTTCSTGASAPLRYEHVKSDSVDFGNTNQSITPFANRSFLDLTQFTDKGEKKSIIETTSLLEERVKSSTAANELLHTLSRLSSTVRDSVDKRKEADKVKRKEAISQLTNKYQVLKMKVHERGFVLMRRALNHSKRMRLRLAMRLLAAIKDRVST